MAGDMAGRQKEMLHRKLRHTCEAVGASLETSREATRRLNQAPRNGFPGLSETKSF
jgi:hypothetical protein